MLLNEIILEEAKKIESEIIAHRRWLHQHAGTGFDIADTKEYVKSELTKLGYCPQDCGKAGLTATIGSGKANQTFLLRADMDALPIQEDSGVAFACTNDKMHACGHDMHTSMLLGAAKLLKMHESEIDGRIKLMFQPAEEIFEGSKDMIDAGVLKDPDVDAALMIHVMTGVPMPVGTVVVSSPGVSAPAADYFSIAVQGKGCHGSTPHLGVDSLSIAAHILLALQELSARELKATDHAVLTVGRLNGGTAGNAIADSALMEGTIRTYDESVREMLKQRMTEIASGIAATFRGTATVTFTSGCPTLTNDKAMSEKAYKNTCELLGTGTVFTSAALSKGAAASGGGSEDFAYISQEVPSVMLALAAGEPDKGHTHPLHHPKTTFDENALAVGSAVYAYNALTWRKE